MELLNPPPPSARQAAVADIVDHRVPIAWHEAVAVVRQLALGARAQAPPIVLPDVSQLLIDTSGAVISDGGEPVADEGIERLNHLLGLLLAPDLAPAELVAFQRDCGRPSAPLDLSKFIADLTFFSRPDDKEEISTLAHRALDYHESQAREDAMTLLSRKARSTGAGADTRQEHARLPHVLLRFLPFALAALVLVAAVLFTWRAGIWWAASRSSSLPTAELAQHVQSELATGLAAAQRYLGVAPHEVAGRDRELSADRRPSPRRATGTVQAAERVEITTVDADGPGMAGELPVATPTPSTDATSTATTGALDEPVTATLYTVTDQMVQPPVLARPQMPAQRLEGLSREAAGELELVVDANGRVEGARLVPASNRFQDRMMVSAAKTWRFEPATKDGVPVRYRLRVPITW
jgi:TonB family protein